MEKRILRNSIITPDGTELVSRHTYDYKQHIDKNKELYTNDGGNDYIRRSINQEPYLDNTIYDTDSIEKKREHLEWGTYGKDGSEGFHYKKYKDMSNAHIEAIINDGYKGVYVEVLKEELEYRVKNDIFVED